MSSKRYAVIEKSRCAACGACIKECPLNAVNIYKGCYAIVNTEVCVGCGKCSSICPAGSIGFTERK